MNKPYNKQSGFLKLIVIIIILIVILSILKIDLRALVASELFQSNLKLAGEILGVVITFLKGIWVNYLQEPAIWLWSSYGKGLFDWIISSIAQYQK